MKRPRLFCWLMEAAFECNSGDQRVCDFFGDISKDNDGSMYNCVFLCAFGGPLVNVKLSIFLKE